MLRLAGRQLFVDFDLIETTGAGHRVLVGDNMAFRPQPSAIPQRPQPARQREAAAVGKVGKVHRDQRQALEVRNKLARVGIVADLQSRIGLATAAQERCQRQQFCGRGIGRKSVVGYDGHGWASAQKW